MVHHVQLPGTSVTRVVTPGNISEAITLLARFGHQAKVVAGGTDLMVELDRGGHADIECLIDITRIGGLDDIAEADGMVTLGALVTHNRCTTSNLVRTAALPLAQACLEVGSPALRNRGTVVGNLVTASPANDTISALVALDAEVVARSASGERVIPLSQFYIGVRSTVLRADELVTGIRFQALGPQWRAVYVKSGLRRAQAISVVHLTLACRVDDGTDTIAEARLAVGSVAPTVVRLAEAEAALVGQRLSAGSGEDIGRSVGRLTADLVSPISDLRATASYRSDQVEHLVARAVATVAAQEQASAFPERPVTLAGSTAGRWPTGSGYRVDHDADSAIEASVNGETIAGPPPGPGAGGSLLDWLRNNEYTGVKEGCAEGECGACTVHLDDMAVLACLVPATRAEKTRVTTVEGLAASSRRGPGDAAVENLSSLQSAFVNGGAVQCGYCIPGFLMAAAKLAEEPGLVPLTADTVAAGLSGNLCRCTGYYKITDAVISAGIGRDPLADTGDYSGHNVGRHAGSEVVDD